MRNAHSILILPLIAALMACGSDGTGPEGEGGEFLIRGSSSIAASSVAPLNVDPATFSVAFLEIRLSSNADCSGPYVTVMTANPARRLDLSTNPEIARTTGLPEGDYPCMAMRISDLLQFVPASSEGGCTSGTSYTDDLYRAEVTTPYLDISGSPITARGDDVTPVEDPVWWFVSTDAEAVRTRGYAGNQILSISAQLHVPGSTTFYWDASNGLGSTGAGCELVGGEIGFR